MYVFPTLSLLSLPPEGAVHRDGVALGGGQHLSAVETLNLRNGNEVGGGAGGGLVNAPEADGVAADGLAEDLPVVVGDGNIVDAAGGVAAVLVGHAGEDIKGLVVDDPVDHLRLNVLPRVLVEVAALGGDVRHRVDGLLGDGGVGEEAAGGQVAAVPIIREDLRADGSLLNLLTLEVGVLEEALAAGDDVAGLLGGSIVHGKGGVDHRLIVGNGNDAVAADADRVRDLVGHHVLVGDVVAALGPAHGGVCGGGGEDGSDGSDEDEKAGHCCGAVDVFVYVKNVIAFQMCCC